MKLEITKLRYAILHDPSSYISTACYLDIAFPLSWGLQSQQRNRVHKFVRRVSGMVGARWSCNSRGRRHGKCHPRGGRGVSTVGCGSQGSSSVIVLEKAKKRDGCHVGDRHTTPCSRHRCNDRPLLNIRDCTRGSPWFSDLVHERRVVVDTIYPLAVCLRRQSITSWLPARRSFETSYLLSRRIESLASSITNAALSATRSYRTKTTGNTTILTYFF